MAIVTFRPDLTEGLIRLYNEDGAFCPFIAHLTPKLFERRIAAKPIFRPEGIFACIHEGKLAGVVFTTFAPNDDKSGFDFSTGLVDGLFFDESRPATGGELLSAALSHLKSRGAKRVIGWATEGGYPFWRDLYCGSEPVMHVAARHVYEALTHAGFAKTQHSVALLARTSGAPPKSRFEYEIRSRPAPRDNFWDGSSWYDLWPMMLEAEIEGVVAGRLGWCSLPATSRRRGVRTAGLYSLAVDSAFRRRGIATALVEGCFEEAARDGAQEILVATGIDNLPALGVYKKFGFAEVFQMVGTRLERL